MMILPEFIKNNDVDYSFNRISSEKICEYEDKTGVKFGCLLKRYILDYGYLGYRHIEFFGINNVQGINSDMLHKTFWLHENFAKTKNLIAIEDQGDGDYYLVDSNDLVYRFVVANNELIFKNIDLFEYILQRFLTI